MKPKLLHITDLYYDAAGRDYYKEDLYLSEQLRQNFDIALCHPRDAIHFMDAVDVALFRNTGPVLYFADDYAIFRTQAKARGIKVFNELNGKADMQGKQYLIDLTAAGYPVIPSVDNLNQLATLPPAERYISKLKLGADSVGMEFLAPADLPQHDFTERFVQPVMSFDYEVSFYFINHQFQYALYAPDPEKRWELTLYQATAADLDFAQKFIEWNAIDYGIQRIDACRMPDGELYLMEVEDLNPYLSLDLLPQDVRDEFVATLSNTLLEFAGK